MAPEQVHGEELESADIYLELVDLLQVVHASGKGLVGEWERHVLGAHLEVEGGQ